MTKWEYKIVDSRDIKRDGLFKGRTRESVERYLSELGEQGWELINVDFRELEGRDSFTGIAKRPKG